MRKEVIQIRCSDVEKEQWLEAARRQRLTLSEWIRFVLRQAEQQPASEVRLFAEEE